MTNIRVKKARGASEAHDGGIRPGRGGAGAWPVCWHWATRRSGWRPRRRAAWPGPRGACCLSGSSLNTLAGPAQSWLSLASVFLIL